MVGALMAGVAVVATAAHCGTETICTMDLAPPGIRVEVRPSDAARVETVSLRVCWDDACETARIELGPTTVSVPQGCDGGGPDAVCSASASPDGGKAGFVQVDGLPGEPVEVRMELRDAAGEEVLGARLRVTPKGSEGDCPTGPQARLIVAGGHVTEG